MARYRLIIVNFILLMTLGGALWARRLDGATASRTDFLRPLYLPYRDWAMKDIPLAPSDERLLQPDATLVRNYEAKDGKSIQLAVIAGHRKQSVHTPGFCMVGEGWEVLSRDDRVLKVGDRRIDANTELMADRGHQLLVTYFFTDGDYCTRSLVAFQGVQLVKRLGRSVPIGALVRIIVPVGNDAAAASRLTDDFASVTLPKVLASISATRLGRG